MLVQVYSNIVIVFSSGLLSAQQIGVLGVYLKLKDIAQSIIGPIQQAVFPTISLLVSKNKTTKLRKLVRNTLLVLSGIVLLFFSILLIFFNDINELLFDNQTSISVMFYFSLVLAFIHFGGVYTKVIVSFNKMKWILYSTIFSGIVSVLFPHYFMNKFGLIGALIVIALSYFFNSIISYFYYRKLMLNKE